MINRKQLRQMFRPIRAEVEKTLRQVVELGHERKEHTPWAQTVRTCQHLHKRQQALWTFLDNDGVEPTTNGADRALLCRIRLLTVCTSLRQQVRDLWDLLEQAWKAHRHGGASPSLLPNN